MKLYYDKTKEPFSFLVKDTTLPSDNLLRFRKNCDKMTVSEKIKKTDNKIEQNQAQYNLDRQTAKISALLSRNIINYEFLRVEDVLPDVFLALVRKSCHNKKKKKNENLALGSEWKKQANIVNDQCKVFKYQINAIDKSNRSKDGVKAEHGVKTEDDVTYFYIGELN